MKPVLDFFFCVFALLGCAAPAMAQKNALGQVMPAQNKLEWVQPVDFDLSSTTGKVVVLNFWATWCPPCVEEVPILNEMAQTFSTDSVQFIAVSWSANKQDIRAFLKEHTVDAAVCIDHDNHLFLKHFRAYSIPYSIILDRSGTAVWEGRTSALNTDILRDYVWHGILPTDPSDERRTMFDLKVQRSLPSDKNLVASDNVDGQSWMSIRAQNSVGLLVNLTYTAGLKHLKYEVEGEYPKEMYNAEMRIDSALRTEEQQRLIIKQLDAVLGTNTVLTFDDREVYEVSVADTTLFNSSIVDTTADGTFKVHEGMLSCNNTRIYTITGHLGRTFNVEFYIEDQELGHTRIDAAIPATSMESAFAYLRSIGLDIRKSIRKLPHMIIRSKDEPGSHSSSP